MTGRFARPGATIHAVTRPLTARERDILDLLLSIDLPSAWELREQAMSVSAERQGMVIDLIVNEGLPSATVVSRRRFSCRRRRRLRRWRTPLVDGGRGCWPSILRAQKFA